jgi:hypothetical protein
MLKVIYFHQNKGIKMLNWIKNKYWLIYSYIWDWAIWSDYAPNWLNSYFAKKDNKSYKEFIKTFLK